MIGRQVLFNLSGAIAIYPMPTKVVFGNEQINSRSRRTENSRSSGRHRHQAEEIERVAIAADGVTR